MVFARASDRPWFEAKGWMPGTLSVADDRHLADDSMLPLMHSARAVTGP
jgi:hypothetical protein